MKLSQIALVSISAAPVALAAPAGATVTQHVHSQATAVVKGSLYTENGSVFTSWTTELEEAPSPSSSATSSVQTLASSSVESSAAPSDNVRVSTIVYTSKFVPTQTSSYVAASSSSSAFSSSYSSSAAEDSSSVYETSSSSEIVSSSSSSSSSAAAPVSTSSSSSSSSSAATATVAVQKAAQSIDPVSTSAAVTSSSAVTTLKPSSTSSSATASPSSSSSSDSSSSAPSGFASTVLDAHNSKRSLHKDTSSLSWSDELATYAQNYADKYDCSGSLTHSGGPYGENLACGYSPEGSIEAWYDEIKSYDFSNPGYSESTGHFTQVVWKSTSQVGCGIKKCGGSAGDYVICSYKDAGNFIGEFAQNVEPTK
ncbi:LAFA_0E16380g1_1 [Lachancea sp. 'fantastica']|nr:LAFA_0E16380g1_1 [Lachancea sp. 'fantastica']